MSLKRRAESASRPLAPRVFDFSGGLRWHLRALISRNVYWAPFRHALAEFLLRWGPPQNKLLLIGPSAGWCMPDALLARYDEIHAIDIDACARFLFRRVHAKPLRDGCNLTWACADFFHDPQSVLAAYPDHAILLCNVAGQRRFHHAHWADAEVEIAALQGLLATRHWASFHDLLSGSCSDNLSPLSLTARGQGADVLRQYGLAGEWFDHLTAALLPENAPRMILPWRFKRDRLHLVEAGWSEPV